MLVKRGYLKIYRAFMAGPATAKGNALIYIDKNTV
jgi:hypothetical protein